MPAETRKVRVVLDDGVYLNEVASGEIDITTGERQMVTDLAALLREAADNVEAERDREFPEGDSAEAGDA